MADITLGDYPMDGGAEWGLGYPNLIAQTFQARWCKSLKATVIFVMSVRPPAVGSAPTGRVSVKFYIGGGGIFTKIYTGTPNLVKNRTNKTGVLHEDPSTFIVYEIFICATVVRRENILLLHGKTLRRHVCHCYVLRTLLSWCVSETTAFNPLKTKRRLLYLKTQFVPRSKHFSSRL